MARTCCCSLAAALAGTMLQASISLAQEVHVRLTSPTAGIELRLIGGYDGGVYSHVAVQTPPAYDPATRRLFVGSQIRMEVDILDISDPTQPIKVGSIGPDDLPPGVDPTKLGGGISSLAYRNGILAVATAAQSKGETGIVVLFNDQGRPIAGPIDVGYAPNWMSFVPGRRALLLVNQADPAPDGSVDPVASLSLITLGPGGARPTVTRIGFERFNGQEAEHRQRGIRIITPGASAAQDLEPEGLAIAEDGDTAWVTLVRNNAIAVVDLTSRRVSKLLPLGSKDLGRRGNGIDASDEDGRINIRSWPVRALYQPDWIAAYQTAGQTYLVTANEGDPRPGEEIRVGEARLDPVIFPNAAILQRSENLGRLNVTRVESDPDQDGVFERLFTLGARSFSIRTTTGRLVFDSGNQFERITARAVPRFFNTPEDENEFDARSDDQGPEPEVLTVGGVAGRKYAFITLERTGGVLAYDITRPQAAQFQEYVSTRNLAVEPQAACEEGRPKPPMCVAAGDLGPESMLFIPAKRSPNRSALLIVRHDFSDTVTIFEVKPRTN